MKIFIIIILQIFLCKFNASNSFLIQGQKKKNSIKCLKMNKSDFTIFKKPSITSALFFSVILLSMGVGCFGRQYETAADIPNNFFTDKKEISGLIVKVTDGDTYRLRHLSSWFSDGSYTGKLSEHTIAVRIAAVDTPETAKFGNAGQKFGKEATDFARNKLLNKKIKVKLLSKDQYDRVIGFVEYSDGLFSKDISEELVKNGLATIYRQRGGEYGKDGIDKWNKLESIAKNKKIGIWSQKNPELPSEFKKKLKQTVDL